jgi:hypothetical protein
VKKLKEAIASTMTCGKTPADEVEHQGKAREQEHETDQGRRDERDHLVARGRRQAHADREKSAGHQQASDISGHDGAVVGLPR